MRELQCSIVQRYIRFGVERYDSRLEVLYVLVTMHGRVLGSFGVLFAAVLSVSWRASACQGGWVSAWSVKQLCCDTKTSILSWTLSM